MSLLPLRRAADAAPSAREGALRLVTPERPPPGEARPPLGKLLVESGALAPGDLLRALAMQEREDARLGEILLAHRMTSPEALMQGLARQWQARIVDLRAEPPDPRLIDLYGPERCLRETVLPWRRLGSVTVIVTARPHRFARLLPELIRRFGPVVMALAREHEVFDAVQEIRAGALTLHAEARVEERMSCREFINRRKQRILAGLSLAVVLLAVTFPLATFSALLGWTVATLWLLLALKGAAAWFAWREIRTDQGGGQPRNGDAAAIAPGRPRPAQPVLPEPFRTCRARTAIARLPVVSVIVPLFREEEIASHLLHRLAKLDYPSELLDICLVMESEDDTTRLTLSRTRLPPWCRVITVPRGTIQTKPRALNYALEFCRGAIVGVWDAEDAPEPDQLHKVVRRFHERGPEVACLQGALDFYNARTNWLSRCFAVEYASWFRVVLPGLARLGLPIPLGGTTLFFRREALEKLGGWDAHNVTEDADLGMRLSRRGFRTELIDSTTFEEANCRALPWIKQRSRWLKGYALTWAVHMRSPRALWRDLGAWRFAGFQLLFLGTLTQFVFAPLLWSFWLMALGLWHPLTGALPAWAIWSLAATFAISELVTIAVGLLGVRKSGHRSLFKWVPSLHFYYPLGALASYKAIAEIVYKPFYWDKTAHGLHRGEEDDGYQPVRTL